VDGLEQDAPATGSATEPGGGRVVAPLAVEETNYRVDGLVLEGRSSSLEDMWQNQVLGLRGVRLRAAGGGMRLSMRARSASRKARSFSADGKATR
jgi:hypothetical protein